MNVTASGNVGIGTTGPGAKLHVTGNVWLQDSSEAGTANRGLLFTPAVFGTGQKITGYGSDNALMLQGFSTSSAPPAVTSEIYLTADGNIAFRAATTLGGATSEKMRITSAGNVGIGTVSPTSTLHVQGSGSTNPFQVSSSTGTGLMVITNQGNVGIGTTTPCCQIIFAGHCRCK